MWLFPGEAITCAILDLLCVSSIFLLPVLSTGGSIAILWEPTAGDMRIVVISSSAVGIEILVDNIPGSFVWEELHLIVLAAMELPSYLLMCRMGVKVLIWGKD